MVVDLSFLSRSDDCGTQYVTEKSDYCPETKVTIKARRTYTFPAKLSTEPSEVNIHEKVAVAEIGRRSRVVFAEETDIEIRAVPYPECP